MKKRILPIMLLAVIVVTMLCPLRAAALTPLDPTAEVSLDLHYGKGGVNFSDLEIGIYRVAEAFPDGTFELVQPYESYPINIHDITKQEQWQYVAQTLWAYIVATQAEPDYEVKTDETGTARFSGLQTGLYFVREVAAVTADGTYIFNHFMIYLPTPQPDGSYLYKIEAKAKCAEYVPEDEYTVIKLWQDAGDQQNRPGDVTVDIYRDGQLWDTQILNADNNWKYTWQVSQEDHSQWTVAERSVPAPYKVTIQQSGGTFSIINIRPVPVEIPHTGDSFTPLPWVLAMCFSGIMLVLLSLYGWRRRT